MITKRDHEGGGSGGEVSRSRRWPYESAGGGIPCIRDSVEDVLLRSYTCAEQHFSGSKAEVWCAGSLLAETEAVWLGAQGAALGQDCTRAPHWPRSMGLPASAGTVGRAQARGCKS